MSTKLMLRKHLEDEGCFTNDLPDILLKGVDTIATNASLKMKLMMSMTELMVFTSHLRKPIQVAEGNLIPVNTITFILAGSGLAKDSSMNMIRKALRPAYEKISEYRVTLAQKQAKRKAVKDGKEEKNWLQYYSAPRDLNSGIGTVEGQLKHMALLEEGELGAAYVQVSELGSELQSNKNITDIIVAMSIGYDIGAIPAKIVKSDEGQVPSIKALPFNGLLFGSQDNILYEDSVKTKFKSEFSTKLARRSFFNFNTEIPVNVEYATIGALIADKKRKKQSAEDAQRILEPLMTELVNTTTRAPLIMSPEAESLYEIYLEYNDLESQDMSRLRPIAPLARKHSHWKTLKLAGSFAILRGSPTLDAIDYIHAINFTEMYSEDLLNFEIELAKDQYEIFCDYMHSRAVNGESEITAHALKKLGFVSGTGSMESKMKALIKMADSYDINGIYTIDDSKIHYKSLVRTSVIGASFKPVDNSRIMAAIKAGADKDTISHEKGLVASGCVVDYNYAESTFESLANLLCMDLAFSPFKYLTPATGAEYDKVKHKSANPDLGVRSKENITGTFKWLCLDVDDSKITDEEAHIMLSSVNHHIARTSDENNPFKFRVIVELDAIAEVPQKIWKYFLASIGESLALNIDHVAQSQLYFGYAGRKVLSVTDATPLEIKEHINFAQSEEAEKPVIILNPKEKQAALGAPMSTFGFAFEAPYGRGSINMIAAAHKAHEYGASRKEIIELIHEINNYWESPMPMDRLQNTIISQIERF